MTARAAYREPMLWLVIGLPAASVVAGILLVVAAVRSGGADEIGDEVQRHAQVQVSELAPDELAQRMRLSVLLRVQDGVVEVLPVSGAMPRTQSLVLSLSHPTHAAQDLRLVLAPSGTGWRLSAPVPEGHDWLARLGPVDGRWRLLGRLESGVHAVLLAPALATD
jgi:hypothetical protein